MEKQMMSSILAHKDIEGMIPLRWWNGITTLENLGGLTKMKYGKRKKYIDGHLPRLTSTWNWKQGKRNENTKENEGRGRERSNIIGNKPEEGQRRKTKGRTSIKTNKSC